MIRSSFIRWNCSAMLGVLLTLGFAPKADAGYFLDWLFGRHQQPLYPVGSYDIPNGQIPIGQPVPGGQTINAGFGTYNAYSYGGAPSYGSVGSGYGCAGSLPVYPNLPNYPTNPNVSPVLPSVAASPPPTFQSFWNRAPVTYYRPVTVYSPITGTNVTQLQACTSYENQVQRVPIYAFRPIFGWNAPNNYSSFYPGTSAPQQATNGSSAFISVPQAGTTYTQPGSQPYVAGYAPLTGANLSGAIPPSVATPIYSPNPVPSYPPPIGLNVPGTMQPQTAFDPAANVAPVLPYNAMPNNGVPGTIWNGGTTSPAIGTGVLPTQQTYPGITAPSNSLPGSSALDELNRTVAPGSNYWSPSPSSAPVNGAENGALNDPESSIAPSLPATSPSASSSTIGSPTANNSTTPRFGLSRVTQQPQPVTAGPAAPPIPQTLEPKNFNDQLNPIPAPSGPDLSPQWNRGLLDSRDLTAFNSAQGRIREIDPSPIGDVTSVVKPEQSFIQQASAITETRFEGSARLRPTTEQKKKPGKLIERATPASPSNNSVDSSGWVANKK
jgi:hypothetical protein